MLKQNDATGRHELPVIVIGPHNESDAVGLISRRLRDNAGEHTAYNSVVPVQFVWRGEGWYWLQVQTKTKRSCASTPFQLRIGPSEQSKRLNRHH